MGGINHQPCRKVSAYLKHSVLMSRCLSLSHSRLEAANVDLEDILLAEMEGKIGRGADMRSSLGQSVHQMRLFVHEVRALVGLMHENGYSDLSTKHSFDFKQLGEAMAADGIVDKAAWDFVAGTVGNGSFYQMFAYFEQEAEHLIELTESLQTCIVGLDEAIIPAGCLTKIVEENGTGNIKVPFAQLYTAWNVFHRRFLASSMLSTEIWYAYNRTGSLVAGAGVKAVAA